MGDLMISPLTDLLGIATTNEEWKTKTSWSAVKDFFLYQIQRVRGAKK
jgi:hypothetical protein